MARRKKKAKTHRRRGRRVSGLSVHPAIKQTGLMLAGAGLGAIAGVFVNQAATTAVPSVPKVAVGVGIMGVGALIPMFVKPSPFVLGAAAGMAGAGAIFAANEAGLSLPGISGMGTGYVTSTVGYLNQNKYPPRMIGGAGNLSGNGSRTVGRINGIFSN